MTVVMNAHAWVLYFVSLVYMYIFVPISYCFMIIYLDIWKSSSILLFAQFAQSVMSLTLYEFYNFFQISVKNVVGILIRITLGLQTVGWSFLCINSSDPWTQDTFPHFNVFFNIFSQRFLVFIVVVFHLLGYVYIKIFCCLKCYYKWECAHDVFSVCLLVVSLHGLNNLVCEVSQKRGSLFDLWPSYLC